MTHSLAVQRWKRSPEQPMRICPSCACCPLAPKQARHTGGAGPVCSMSLAPAFTQPIGLPPPRGLAVCLQAITVNLGCHVGCRCGSDLALLWLWCRLVATAPI